MRIPRPGRYKPTSTPESGPHGLVLRPPGMIVLTHAAQGTVTVVQATPSAWCAVGVGAGELIGPATETVRLFNPQLLDQLHVPLSRHRED